MPVNTARREGDQGGAAHRGAQRSPNVAGTTRFTDLGAVDVWDSLFRWRDGDALRDRTIDCTWRRVAGAVAGEGRAQAPWAQRYMDAFARWQLLPDERLLRRAGTTLPRLPLDGCRATVNAAAFVRTTASGRPQFDHVRFEQAAALAVRFVDDALLHASPHEPRRVPPRVGMLGVGDVLQACGIAYDSDAARRMAADIAASLASGCLEENLRLGRERGVWSCCRTQSGTALLHPCGGTDNTAASASLLRHPRITAIDRQPLLARLANGASDALLPPPDASGAPHDACTPLAHRHDTCTDALCRLHAAVQPFIDAPIDHRAGPAPSCPEIPPCT